MTEAELEECIGKYHGTVYRLALSYVRNSAEAEDICQSAFIKLWEQSSRGDAPENPKAWLVTVTINLSKNLLRSIRFTRCTELEENIPSVSVLTDDETELFQAVTKLPPKYRTVIHLYYYEEYSVKEIAEITGASETVVTTRLYRAREKLKKTLLKEGIYNEKGIQRNV